METANKKGTVTPLITKTILVLLFIALSIFFIFGLIGRAIQIMIKNQAKRVDKFMSKLITTKVVNNEKDFVRIAKYKSKIYFFKHSIIPMILLLITFILWISAMSITKFENSMFVLFGRMIYPWEGMPIYVPPFGFDFSSVTANYVDMSNWFSIVSLITIVLFLISLLWYFFNVSGFIARAYRIKKLSNTMFSKNLNEVDLSTFLTTTNQNVIPTTLISKDTNS